MKLVLSSLMCSIIFLGDFSALSYLPLCISSTTACRSDSISLAFFCSTLIMPALRSSMNAELSSIA